MTVPVQRPVSGGQQGPRQGSGGQQHLHANHGHHSKTAMIKRPHRDTGGNGLLLMMGLIGGVGAIAAAVFVLQPRTNEAEKRKAEEVRIHNEAMKLRNAEIIAKNEAFLRQQAAKAEPDTTKMTNEEFKRYRESKIERDLQNAKTALNPSATPPAPASTDTSGFLRVPNPNASGKNIDIDPDKAPPLPPARPEPPPEPRPTPKAPEPPPKLPAAQPAAPEVKPPDAKPAAPAAEVKPTDPKAPAAKPDVKPPPA